MDLLNNPWILGIGTGVVSTLVSGFLADRFTQNREKTAYRRKLDAGNKDVIHSIRPSVAEEIIPSLDVMEAVISATAQRHQVQARDLLGIPEICDILVDEIMVNPFLGAERKVSFCNELVKRKKEARKKTKRDIGGPKPPYSMSKFLGFITGVTSGVLTITLATFLLPETPTETLFTFAIIFTVSTFVPLFGLMLAYWSKRLKYEIKMKHTEQQLSNKYLNSSWERNELVHRPIKKK